MDNYYDKPPKDFEDDIIEMIKSNFPNFRSHERVISTSWTLYNLIKDGKLNLRNKNCLDVGTGSGSGLIALKLLGAKEIKGIDIPHNKEFLRKKYTLEGLEESKTIYEDIRNPKIQDEFDIVTAFAFPSDDTYLQAFEGAYSLTRLNGKILFTGDIFAEKYLKEICKKYDGLFVEQQWAKEYPYFHEKFALLVDKKF